MNPIRNNVLDAFRASLVFSLVALVLAPAAIPQNPNDPLSVEIYTLGNGLTVYLNEDHSLPNIFGAVAVKGGSKRDPPARAGRFARKRSMPA